MSGEEQKEWEAQGLIGGYSGAREVGNEYAYILKAEKALEDAHIKIAKLSAQLQVARDSIKDFLEAVDPIVNPDVTRITTDGTLDLISAVKKGKAALEEINRREN